MATYSETLVPQLIINQLTQAQYDAALQNNEINDNELYFITDSRQSGGGVIVADSAPAGNASVMWVNSNTGAAYYWNGSEWTPTVAVWS